ncbi:MAG: hypothetical protein ACLRS8_09745 [Parabacteroides merdae]
MDEMLKVIDMAAALGSRCIAATALGLEKIDRDDFEKYTDNYRRILNMESLSVYVLY